MMISENASQLSSQEMGERFDLLATDAKEYAVFLVEPEGHLLCWNAGAERTVRLPVRTKSSGSTFPASFRPKTFSTASPSMNSRWQPMMGGPTAFAGKCGKMGHGSGVRPS